MFIHMSAQQKQSEMAANRTNLTSLIANFMNNPAECKATLSQIQQHITAGKLNPSNEHDHQLNKILTKSGGTVVDLIAEAGKLENQYGMSGYVVFQMKCEETGGAEPCKKCAGSYPQNCEKKWSLSLISQTTINNMSSFNKIFKIPIIIKHTGTADSEFECNSPTGTSLSGISCQTTEVLTGFDNAGQPVCVPAFDFSNADCGAGQTLQGFDTNGQKICVVAGAPPTPCPPGKVMQNGVCVNQTSGCSATTRSNCRLSAKTSGSSGSCKSGLVGFCNYKCNNGSWTEISNTCRVGANCASLDGGSCQTISSYHGDTSGYCKSGYTGTCKYKCYNGTWTPVSNNCVLSP